jgi:hypothetical protein
MTTVGRRFAYREHAHPMKNVLTTAMRRAWRTTTHLLPFCMSLLLLAPGSLPHNKAPRISNAGLFTQVPRSGQPVKNPLLPAFIPDSEPKHSEFGRFEPD